MDGLEPFEVVDEPYILELRTGWEVLLDSRYTGEAPGYVEGPWLEDVPRPQALTRRQGAGEILYVAPGHACGRFDLRPFIDEMPVQRGPWFSPGYRELLRRAIRWGTAEPIRPTAVSSPASPAHEAINNGTINETMSEGRQELHEQLIIERIARRIDRAVDDKDWSEMRAWFEDTIAVDIGVVAGASVIEMSADDFVREVAALNPSSKISYHSSTNSIVNVEASTATLRSHSYGWNRCDEVDPPIYEVWGSMEYRLRRGPDGWRVTHVRLVKWREAGNPAVSELRGPVEWRTPAL